MGRVRQRLYPHRGVIPVVESFGVNGHELGRIRGWRKLHYTPGTPAHIVPVNHTLANNNAVQMLVTIEHTELTGYNIIMDCQYDLSCAVGCDSNCDNCDEGCDANCDTDNCGQCDGQDSCTYCDTSSDICYACETGSNDIITSCQGHFSDFCTGCDTDFSQCGCDTLSDGCIGDQGACNGDTGGGCVGIDTGGGGSGGGGCVIDVCSMDQDAFALHAKLMCHSMFKLYHWQQYMIRSCTSCDSTCDTVDVPTCHHCDQCDYDSTICAGSDYCVAADTTGP